MCGKAIVVNTDIKKKNNTLKCAVYYNTKSERSYKKTINQCHQHIETLYLFAVTITPVELFSLDLALHHGVNSLQVGRVGHHSQADVLVGHAVQTLMRHAQVVLDVPRAFISCLQLRVKLTDDLLQGLPTHIGQDVQTTSGRQIRNCTEKPVESSHHLPSGL